MPRADPSRPRRALVTGAAQGIGAAIADRLEHRDGFEVVRVDRQESPDGRWRSCDITDSASLDALAAAVGHVDVLVNNAGIWRFAPLVDADADDVRAVLDVNVVGTLRCAQVFGRGMCERGYGSIVNIASIAADQVSPGVGIYPASKAAVIALTRQMALEWGPFGVRANAVGPGLVPTEGTGNVYDDEGVCAARSAAVPLRRLATPKDVADTVAFFASDESAYVTGQVVFVDGGLTQGLMGLMPRPAATGGPRIGTADAASVVRRHLAAIVAGDLTGMSADYTLDAVLERPGGRYNGREAIAGYFATVGSRLGGGRVVPDEPVGDDDGRVVVRWRITGGQADGTSGSDDYVVSGGWITAQSVTLDTADF